VASAIEVDTEPARGAVGCRAVAADSIASLFGADALRNVLDPCLGCGLAKQVGSKQLVETTTRGDGKWPPPLGENGDDVGAVEEALAEKAERYVASGTKASQRPRAIPEIDNR